MKKLPIAAAALLLGTSAYAMIPSGDPTDGTMQDPYTVEPTTAVAYDEAPALQPASADSWANAEPVAYSADANDPALKTVTATSDDVKAAEWAKADAQFDAAADADWDAAAKAKLDSAAMADSAELQPASFETGFAADDKAATWQPASAETGFVADDGAMADTTFADETVVAGADLTPRPAAGNYPACSPGPGDDRCIQLYEPGVEEQLASWSQPTGGFAGASDTQVAMGGPYEPVDSATETERLNQQALADSNRALQMAAADQPVEDSAIETAMADDTGNIATDETPAEDEDTVEI
jgi:hypothetical protein